MKSSGSRYTVSSYIVGSEHVMHGIFDQACDAICYIAEEITPNAVLVNPAPIDASFNEIARYVNEKARLVIIIHLIEYYRY